MPKEISAAPIGQQDTSGTEFLAPVAASAATAVGELPAQTSLIRDPSFRRLAIRRNIYKAVTNLIAIAGLFAGGYLLLTALLRHFS